MKNLNEMPESSKFSDKEISLIKDKQKKGFNRGIIITILLSPIICLFSPHLSNIKRGGKSLLEGKEYWGEVIFFSLFWFVVMVITWISNTYRINKQFLENKELLKRKTIVAIVKRKSRSVFSSSDDVLATSLSRDFKYIKVDKDKLGTIEINDEIQIEYEEHTNTILKIEKVNQLR